MVVFVELHANRIFSVFCMGFLLGVLCKVAITKPNSTNTKSHDVVIKTVTHSKLAIRKQISVATPPSPKTPINDHVVTSIVLLMLLLMLLSMLFLAAFTVHFPLTSYLGRLFWALHCWIFLSTSYSHPNAVFPKYFPVCFVLSSYLGPVHLGWEGV